MILVITPFTVNRIVFLISKNEIKAIGHSHHIYIVVFHECSISIYFMLVPSVSCENLSFERNLFVIASLFPRNTCKPLICT